MQISCSVLQNLTNTGLAQAHRYRLAAENDPEDETQRSPRFDRPKAAREELPYKVELWDEAKTAVEQILAVTANGSIGYAAYYAALREYPDRYVTLRHNNRTIARSGGSER
jgi:hypothetical protein